MRVGRGLEHLKCHCSRRGEWTGDSLQRGTVRCWSSSSHSGASSEDRTCRWLAPNSPRETQKDPRAEVEVGVPTRQQGSTVTCELVFLTSDGPQQTAAMANFPFALV